MKKTSTLLLILASVSTISIAQVQRMVLHEVFSSSTCPPCVAGNVNLKTVFNENHVLSLSLSLSSPSKSLYAFGSTPDFQSAELPL